MWRNVGVRRDGDSLAEAKQTVEHWCRYVLARQFNDPGGWELQNMISLARLMIEAALEREESRGAHVRTDYPEADERPLEPPYLFPAGAGEGLKVANRFST